MGAPADTREQAAAVLRRAAALGEATELLARYRDDDAVAAAAATAARARARLGHGTDHTVVAVAGQTGAGKSSLVNALVGAEVSRVAVTRPTTSQPQAVVFGGGADDLLDWLGVRDRHVVAGEPGLDGLVLLDLPDVDSIEAGNRAEAARLIGLADLLVVVTDPQKYADQVLHERVLAPLAEHGSVIEVVLNKADLLADRDLVTCRDELASLLARDGLGAVQPSVVSAATGRGLEQLRETLAAAVTARRSAIDRLLADLRTVVPPLVPSGVATVKEDTLVSTAATGLAGAVGTDHIASVIAAQQRHDGAIATGWPVTRWVLRWRRSPMRDVPTLGRRQVASDAVRATLREVGEQAGAGLGDPWDRFVRDVARDREDEVTYGLDHVTSRGAEELRAAPGWWRAVSWVHGLLLLTAVVGGLWLLALVLGSSLLLLDLEAATPRWRGMPWPALGLIGGLVGGWVLAVLAAVGVRAGARRRQRRAAAVLEDQVADVARRDLVAPLLTSRAEHARIIDLLATVVD